MWRGQCSVKAIKLLQNYRGVKNDFHFSFDWLTRDITILKTLYKKDQCCTLLLKYFENKTKTLLTLSELILNNHDAEDEA